MGLTYYGLHLLKRAEDYNRVDNQEGVLEYLNKAIDVDKNSPSAYLNRALYYRHNRDYKAAQKDYDKAVSLTRSTEQPTITLFNQEDIFRYGRFEGIYKRSESEKREHNMTKQNEDYLPYDGSICIGICLAPHKNGEICSYINCEIIKLPYFLFRKIYKKPIYNYSFVKLEYVIARTIFYLMTYVFKRKIKTIDVDYYRPSFIRTKDKWRRCKRESNTSVIKEYKLYYSNLNGYGDIICKDCGHSEETTYFLHTTNGSTTGLQCQSCGKLHSIKDMKSSEEYYCECGSKLEREKPIFCPKCRSKNVKNNTHYMY